MRVSSPLTALKGPLPCTKYDILPKPSGSVAWTWPKEVCTGCASGTLKSRGKEEGERAGRGREGGGRERVRRQKEGES